MIHKEELGGGHVKDQSKSVLDLLHFVNAQ